MVLKYVWIWKKNKTKDVRDSVGIGSVFEKFPDHWIQLEPTGYCWILN